MIELLLFCILVAILWSSGTLSTALYALAWLAATAATLTIFVGVGTLLYLAIEATWPFSAIPLVVISVAVVWALLLRLIGSKGDPNHSPIVSGE